MTKIVCWFLLALCLCMGVFFTVVLPAQSQETINERQRYAVEMLDGQMADVVSIQRAATTERAQLDKRLSVVEDTMFEVKWLGRTVMGVLIAQLGIMVKSTRRRLRRYDYEDDDDNHSERESA